MVIMMPCYGESMWRVFCPFLIVLCCAVFDLAGAIKNKNEVKNLIEKAVEVMTLCAEEFGGVPPKERVALLTCTAKKQAKYPGVFPKELFEVVQDKLLILEEADWLTAFWKRLNPKAVKEDTKAVAKALEKAKGFVDMALDMLPIETLETDMTTAAKEMKRFRHKGKTFEDVFGKRFHEIKELGDGKNVNGLAYLVKDDTPDAKFKEFKEPVLKAVLASGAKKDGKQGEFEVHKQLDGHDWSKVTILGTDGKETVIGAKEKFIPRVIGDVEMSRDHVFDFIIMERIGITLKEWLALPPTDDRRPTKTELLNVLSRTYSILTAMHSAGFRHGDNHRSNWALSRTDTKVIYLFDFGTSDIMADYSWMATDWFRWVTLLADFRTWIPDTDAQPEKDKNLEAATLKKSMTTLQGDLVVELAKILWFNPDELTRNLPFQELVAPTYKHAMEKIAGFKEFRKAAEAFLGIKDSGIETSKVLYRWQPKPGERRRRDTVDWDERFLVAIEQEAF